MSRVNTAGAFETIARTHVLDIVHEAEAQHTGNWSEPIALDRSAYRTYEIIIEVSSAALAVTPTTGNLNLTGEYFDGTTIHKVLSQSYTGGKGTLFPTSTTGTTHMRLMRLGSNEWLGEVHARDEDSRWTRCVVHVPGNCDGITFTGANGNVGFYDLIQYGSS